MSTANFKEEQLILANSKYTNKYLISDRQIAHKFLKNWCDATLTAKINKKMNQHENTKKGAPLFSFYMLKLKCLNLDTTVCAVVKCIDNMKFAGYDGKNVSTSVTYLCTVNKYLTQNDAVPNNLNAMVFNVIKRGTTEEFKKQSQNFNVSKKKEGNKRSADSILDKLKTL